MMMTIKIVVDTNDADYATRVSKISDRDLAKVMPLIKAIKKFKPYQGACVSGRGTWTHDHNFPRSEYFPRIDLGEKTVEEIYADIGTPVIDLFSEYLPSYGFHTVESIEIAPAVKWKKLL